MIGHELWMRQVSDALNTALANDPQAVQLAVEVSPCVANVEVQGLGLRTSVVVAEGAMRLHSGHAVEADIDISGPPLALAKLALNPTNDRSGGAVRIRGDAFKLQGLRRLMAHLDLDAEEWMALRVGDVLAHQLGNWVRGTTDWARRTGGHLSQDAADYLLAEVALLTSREQLDEFGYCVDVLRDDVERVAARISRLEAAHSYRGPSEGGR